LLICACNHDLQEVDEYDDGYFGEDDVRVHSSALCSDLQWVNDCWNITGEWYESSPFSLNIIMCTTTILGGPISVRQAASTIQ